MELVGIVKFDPVEHFLTILAYCLRSYADTYNNLQRESKKVTLPAWESVRSANGPLETSVVIQSTKQDLEAVWGGSGCKYCAVEGSARDSGTT